MSNNISRKIERNQEKQELLKIKNTYGKKPKEKCPKCNKKSLFITNKNGEVFCIRCDKMVAIKK